MSDYKIAIKIAGQLESSFKSALKGASDALGNFAKIGGKATVGAFAATGAAMAALGKKAVDVGSDFEASMSQVQATMLLDKSTEEGAKNFQILEDAARECGRSTAFSATEAAQGLNYLALAGYSAQESADALPTILKLAGAGAMDLAQASDMVTDAMSALGLERTQDQLNSFADELAMTASKSNTSVAQLGEAILTVGGTAKILEGGTTELNTALGLLADNGIKGSEGGTKLRNMILSLSAPTDKAAKAMNALGVSAFDTDGNMRPLQDVFMDLNDAMAGMDEQTKTSTLNDIFNKTDLKAVNALLGTSAERWSELTDAIDDSAGACQDMYDIQLDNLKGDLDIASSAAQDLGISVYKAMAGDLREGVQIATGYVTQLSDAFNQGGFDGLATEIGSVLADAVTRIAEKIPEFLNLAGQVISSFVSGLQDHFPEILDAAGGIVGYVVDGVTNHIGDAIQGGVNIVTTIAGAIGDNSDTILEKGLQLVTSVFNGIGQGVPQLLFAGAQLVASIAKSIVDHLPEILAVGVQLVTNFVNGLIQNLHFVLQFGMQLIIYVVQGILANLPQIFQAGVQILFELASGLLGSVSMIIDAAGGIVTSIWDTLMSTNWLDVGLNIIKAIGSGIVNGAKAIGSAVKNSVVGFFGGGGDKAEAEASNMDTSQAKLSFDTSAADSANEAMNKVMATHESMQSAITSEPIDMAAMFQENGTTQMMEDMKTAVDDAGSSIENLGVTSSTSVENMLMAFEDGGNELTATVQGYSMKFVSAWTSVHGVIMSQVNATVNAIRNAFANMSITVPAPKLPHISVSTHSVGYGDGGSVTVPDFSVAYFAKGGIMTDPTMFGLLNGMNPMVGGEAGAEAILPLDTLWTKMKEVMVEVFTGGSGSVFGGLLDRLTSGKSENRNQMQLAGTGMTVNYSPVFQVNGNATKEDIVSANKMSQQEFAQMMKQWQKQNNRIKF